jgi:hypothetical protein
VTVHPRIHRLHPEVGNDDVLAAWSNCSRFIPRQRGSRDDFIAVGADGKGRLVEMVAAIDDAGDWVIFHAMTPPSKRMLGELGFMDERRQQ